MLMMKLPLSLLEPTTYSISGSWLSGSLVGETVNFAPGKLVVSRAIVVPAGKELPFSSASKSLMAMGMVDAADELAPELAELELELAAGFL